MTPRVDRPASATKKPRHLEPLLSATPRAGASHDGLSDHSNPLVVLQVGGPHVAQGVMTHGDARPRAIPCHMHGAEPDERARTLDSRPPW
jgi:hypothetical protein